jgi:hypothetical protein
MLKILVLALDLGKGVIELRMFLGQRIYRTRPNGGFAKFACLRDEGHSKQEKENKQKDSHWSGEMGHERFT